MTISAYPYLTWAGKLRVAVHHSSGGIPLAGRPGTRTLELDADEARALYEQLGRALATPPTCIDCGSESHTVDDPLCPVASADDCDD